MEETNKSQTEWFHIMAFIITSVSAELGLWKIATIVEAVASMYRLR